MVGEGVGTTTSGMDKSARKHNHTTLEMNVTRHSAHRRPDTSGQIVPGLFPNRNMISGTVLQATNIEHKCPYLLHEPDPFLRKFTTPLS